MRKFRISLNGKSYEVAVEELDTEETPSVPVAETRTSRTDFTLEEEKVGHTRIYAPVSGTILSVSVSVGDSVKKGDIICTLEAMKVESLITAPVDGTVLSVNVAKGIQVTGGALLASIE